ncbi:hypothetical protein DFJ74DRAFT_655721 [Hyaloraphidium curvatum]|nr:hypothetical protein DFJ74DRAFT_655721 [Hyaloraphidium curvatum]
MVQDSKPEAPNCPRTSEVPAAGGPATGPAALECNPASRPSRASVRPQGGVEEPGMSAIEHQHRLALDVRRGGAPPRRREPTLKYRAARRARRRNPDRASVPSATRLHAARSFQAKWRPYCPDPARKRRAAIVLHAVHTSRGRTPSALGAHAIAFK